MYPAAMFTVEDEAALVAHLAAHPFAAIAAAPGGTLRIAHAPVLVRRVEGELVLDFHLARANALSTVVGGGFRAVAVSLAAEAYVSPDWYESADQVPTWNYVSVEAEGPVAALGEAGLIALLDDLSAQEEARFAPKPSWTRSKMSPGRFEAMTRAIVGLRMTIERLQGTSKLGQKKSDADRAGVIAALGDHPVARLMRGGS